MASGMVTLDTLISDLGTAIGIAGFELDAGGQAQLALDGHVVDVLGDRRDGRLMVSSLIGELPEEGRAEAMTRLLAANAMLGGTRGATLGVPAGSGAVILARALDSRHETGESLAHAIVALAEAAQECRALLTAVPEPVPIGADPSLPLIRI